MTMPKQKPGRSFQAYGTPPDLLHAVKNKLGIDDFSLDLAASADNAVCSKFYTEQDDSLRPDLSWASDDWAWLNPPFAHIEPWVKKACQQAQLSNGVQLAMLVPASTGANWWRDWVDGKCRILLLNGRITFVGCTDPYVKDCAILLYNIVVRKGYEVWDWR